MFHDVSISMIVEIIYFCLPADHLYGMNTVHRLAITNLKDIFLNIHNRYRDIRCFSDYIKGLAQAC